MLLGRSWNPKPELREKRRKKRGKLEPDLFVPLGILLKLKESVTGRLRIQTREDAIAVMIAVIVQRRVMVPFSTRGPSVVRGLLQVIPDSWAPGMSLILLGVTYQGGHQIFPT